MKNRVTGLGGFFFKTKDPDHIKQWYGKHLGIPVDQYGWTFWWKDKEGNDCSTQWSPFKDTTTYFQPSEKQFMMNFRVENLHELLAASKEMGEEAFISRVPKSVSYDWVHGTEETTALIQSGIDLYSPLLDGLGLLKK